MKKQFQGIKVWKYIGDEILFFKLLHSVEELLEILPGSFQVLNRTLENLQKKFNSIFKPLSIKGTIWCAPVILINGQEIENLGKELENRGMEKTENIAFEVIYENQASLIDFLGPDIDTGFRISKYAEKGKLVISADLAYLLLIAAPTGRLKTKKNSLVSKLKIVSYEDLKGIWQNRFYPVIWYYNDWGKIQKSFEYDDRFKSKIINNIYLNCIEDLEMLPRIFQQLNRLEEKNNLLKILEDSEKIAKEKAKEKPGKQIPLIVSDENTSIISNLQY